MQTQGRHSLDRAATLPKAGDKGSTHPKNAVWVPSSSAPLGTHPADNGKAACPFWSYQVQSEPFKSFLDIHLGLTCDAGNGIPS